MPLTNRFDDALVYASRLHRDQDRKGTEVPYVSHLLAVSALVLEAGGTEDLAIAALLHDAIEDHPDETSLDEVETRFGAAVARVVKGCSDVLPDELGADGQKPDWRWRKERYLNHLEAADGDVLLVSCADKLHNATAILRDHRRIGVQLWSRFNADAAEILWYQRSLADVFSRRLDSWLADELDRTVTELEGALNGR